MTEKIRYVLGFSFDHNLNNVLLVRKKKGPEINIGKLNGVGGKVEKGETFEESMSREFTEETKGRCHWNYVGYMFGDDWEFKIYSGEYEGLEPGKTNDIGEELEWEEIHSVLDPRYNKSYAQNVSTMLIHILFGQGKLSLDLTTGGL